MATNSDANLQSVTVDLVFTRPRDGCVPEGIYEALETMNLRFNMPIASTTGASVFASALQNNMIRIDPEGGIYAPAITALVIPEQIVRLSDQDGPGSEAVAFLPTPGLSDPLNAIKDLQVSYNPSDAAVNRGPVTISTTSAGIGLRIGFTRVNYGQTSPYTPVEISVSGIIWQVAQPEN